MVRLWLIVGVIAAAFYVYSIVDCALSDRGSTRALPKGAWVAIVIVFPLIGAALWFAFGRGRRGRNGQRRVAAPDDDPEFLRGLDRDLASEERIRDLEARLSDLDKGKKGGDTDKPGRSDG